jgi:hypothetical protein
VERNPARARGGEAPEVLHSRPPPGVGQRLHANGASIKQVSVWLGHSSVQVTERYIRVFQTESTGHEFLPR